MSHEIARTVRIETETDFNTLAQLDAEDRDLSGIEFPTRAQVENGLPMPKETDAPAPFVIDDENKAEWALGKMAAIESEKARVKAQFADIKARADERINQLETDLRSLHSRFDEPLRAWAEGEATRRKRQTVTLMNGSIVFRNEKARMFIADQEAAFVHARTAYPNAIKRTAPVEPTDYLDAAAYIAAAEASGELLPGMDARPALTT